MPSKNGSIKMLQRYANLYGN